MWTSDTFWCNACRRDFVAFGFTPQLAICDCGEIGQRLLPEVIDSYLDARDDLTLVRWQIRVMQRVHVPPS